MICKIKHGKGFKGVLAYAMKPSKHAEIIASTATSEVPREIASEFTTIARRSTRTKSPVAHYVFSLADGEHLPNEGWERVIAVVVEELGADAYIAVQHQDTSHAHAHLILSRVNLDGRAWSDSNERRRMRRVCMSLELELGLTSTNERAKREAPASTRTPATMYPTFNYDAPSRYIER